MAEGMDDFIKNSLSEHYENVKASLKEYTGAIENMVSLLYDKENITGEEVREIIEKFEKENGMESKLSPVHDEIADELKEDASMVKKRLAIEDENKNDND